MTRRLVAPLALALLTLSALPSLAQAELTKLDTNLTTGEAPSDTDRIAVTGDVVSVTATGDAALTLEYRFVVQHSTGSAWENVAESSWSATNNYSFDTGTGGPYAAGNYRLVSLVRETGAPADFLANYQSFTYGPASVALCEYVNGKTFTNATPVAASLALGTLSLGDQLAMLSAPGIAYSLASHGDGVVSLAFSGGNVSVTMQNDVSMTGSLSTGMIGSTPLNGTATYGAALTGTYSCSGSTLTVNASGASTATTGSGMSGLGVAIYLHITGNLTGNTSAGTLTAGDGAVFGLPAEPVAPAEPTPGIEEAAAGTFGLLPLSLLALFGLGRRRRS